MVGFGRARSTTVMLMIILSLSVLTCSTGAAGPPADDPVARYKLEWTGQINWFNVVIVTDFPGQTIEQRCAAAQAAVAEKGGGIVYFPAGVYEFKGSLGIRDRVVVRGADPLDITDARDSRYSPPTRFEFPPYVPVFEGEGTPIDTAFKGIYLEDPENSGNCGVVNIAVNRGHIDLREGPDHKAGRNRLVYGCLLRSAAVADPAVPDNKTGQLPWQRFTQRHHAAIMVKTQENILVANNRLPESPDDNFLMKGYLLQGKPFDILFDYDNRPGLYVNDYAIGGPGGQGPNGTPQTHPWSFRRGIVIRDNYIFCTGRCAISFTGDGTICANNVIRFKDDVVRYTTTGTAISRGSSTNDNRAVQMRGWRWTVEGNDYTVYRNWAADKAYRINDGEGLMHEDHVNSTVLDSKVINNKGNTYISIFKTGGINGLLVQGNDIRTAGGIEAIYVVGDRNNSRHECKNVTIAGNTTSGSGIRIEGSPAENNLVKNNRHLGPGGKITNKADAACQDNVGYEQTKSE